MFSSSRMVFCSSLRNVHALTTNSFFVLSSRFYNLLLFLFIGSASEKIAIVTCGKVNSANVEKTFNSWLLGGKKIQKNLIYSSNFLRGHFYTFSFSFFGSLCRPDLWNAALNLDAFSCSRFTDIEGLQKKSTPRACYFGIVTNSRRNNSLSFV